MTMTEQSTSHFVRSDILAPLTPPRNNRALIGVIRERLFSSWGDTALTLILIVLIYLCVSSAINFTIIHAAWPGQGREACAIKTGACWPFVEAKLPQFIYGRYPEAERWRVILASLLVAISFPLFLIPALRAKRLAVYYALLQFPIITILLAGGVFGLAPVETPLWGGLALTVTVAFTGMAASLPLGVLLALGRRSELPVVRYLSIAFIEFWRGVPLVTVLFMASVMAPLFLPQSTPSSSKLLRALAAIAVFFSAYVAEVIRGGLQGVPKGQFEAASALGLGYWRTMWLVALPQTIKNVLPSLVNIFITLFKDTTLVLTIGLFDFLGMIQLGLVDPKWATPSVSLTAYVFAAAVYWAFCFTLSQIASLIERRMSLGERGHT
jgi:general L-amino acid transport system permease protein